MSTPISWSESVKQPEDGDLSLEETGAGSTVERVISLCYRKGKLGMAIWMQDDPAVIRLLEEQHEMPGYPSVESIIFEIDPTLLILPGRGEYPFIEEMKDLKARFERERGMALEISYGLSAEYKAVLFAASFGPLVTEQQMRDNTTTIAAAAALTALLRKMQGSPNSTFPGEVQWFSLSKCMAIDYDSLLALQVLDDKLHPNMHFGERRGGLCLQNLMNKCKSPAGGALFKTWLMRPLIDVPSILERQDKVELLIDTIIRKGLQGEIHKYLRGLPRIEKILARLGKPHFQRILELAKFLKGSTELCNMSERLRLNLLPNDEETKGLLSTINSIIDLEQSKKQEKIAIRQHVNPDLDRLRHQYRTLPSYLTAKVQLVAERVKDPAVKAINIVYFPQLGFLVTISLEDGHKAENLQSTIGQDFSLQFVTEHVAYFKDPITKGLDDEIGDIYADMTDLEIEIVLFLIDQILPFKHSLCRLGRKLAELDCLLCLAEFAAENSLVKPTINDEGSLYIVEGRHLLQERICDTVVSNDLHLGSEAEGSIMVLTGPNSSGKSIYMKQNALIIILGQMGSFVPAKEAILGIVDRVFTRIQTRESSLSGQSAFQTDLRQIKKAIEGCTSRSLLLIDEFGKGTNPVDGVAIFAATVKYLAQPLVETEDPPQPRPRVIAITHFHEVYELDRRESLGKIKWCTMDILENPLAHGEDDCKAITFLYRVINGKAVGSLGIRCAKVAGLPEEIISRAKELYTLYQAQVPPIKIRYAQLNPQLEATANQIIEVLREGKNRDMATLQALSQEFLSIEG